MIPLFTTFDYTIIKTKLGNFKSNKSPGPDKLHPRVLKELANEICDPLNDIFSSSFNDSMIPDIWKCGNIAPIYKKGSKSDPANYRPVCLTTIFSKVMESIIRDNILFHLRSNNLLSNQQFDFISGRSTTLQLLNVTDNWLSTLDHNGTVEVIYTDFRKAFDAVPHKRLLLKIIAFGITGKLLS